MLLDEWNQDWSSQNSKIGVDEPSHLRRCNQTFALVLKVLFYESNTARRKIEEAVTAFQPILNREQHDTRQPTATEVNEATALLSLAYSYAVGKCPAGKCEILMACIDALADYKWFIEAKSKKP